MTKYNILRITKFSLFNDVICQFICFSITIRELNIPDCLSNSYDNFYQVCNLSGCFSVIYNCLNCNQRIILNDDI